MLKVNNLIGFGKTEIVAAPTGIQFVGFGDQSDGALPPHQVGDLIVAFTFREGNTSAPAEIPGYTSHPVTGGNGSNSAARVSWRVAGAGDAYPISSQGWTLVGIYRNATILNQAAEFASYAESSQTIQFPARSMGVPASSWTVCCGGNRSELANMPASKPPGFVERGQSIGDGGQRIVMFDSNAAIGNFSGSSTGIGGQNNGYVTVSFELRKQAA